MTSGYTFLHTQNPGQEAKGSRGLYLGSLDPISPSARWGPPDPQLRAGPSSSAVKGPEPSIVPPCCLPL